MAIQSQPSRISEPFAGSGTKNVIPATNATPSASQAASWASGFPPECSQPISAGGCPVPRDDMNGVLNWLSQGFAFSQDGGVWEWSALADYDIQRMVRGSDGLLYWSVAQSGPDVAAGAQDPTADTLHDYWLQIPTNDGDLVHISGSEEITGFKFFDNSIALTIGGDSPYPYAEVFISKDYIQGAAPTQTATASSIFRGLNGDPSSLLSRVFHTISASGSNGVSLNVAHYTGNKVAYLNLATDNAGSTAYASFTGVSSVFPSSAGVTLGENTTAHRWGQIYSSSSTISTSDERAKTSIEAVPDAVLDAWGDVNWQQFQMRDAVEEKGEEKARLHNGVIAQRIAEAFRSRGLDASRYGLFCYDEWQESEAQVDDRGNEIVPAEEAGDLYSVRYEEALCMEAAYQRRRADRAEARIAALEERLAVVEAKLG